MKDAIILGLLFIIGIMVALPEQQVVTVQPEPAKVVLSCNGWMDISGAWVYVSSDMYNLSDACFTFIGNGYLDYTVISWEQLRNGLVIENYPRRGL